MLAVGLTGGIGSGKSTVSSLLARRGAAVIDADAIAREVQAPGGTAYRALIDRFGPQVVLPDGALDRAAIAAVVFSDPQALADLNAISHPAIGRVIAERLASYAATDEVVVLDVPLLAESKTLRGAVAAVIVVDAPVEIAVRRLVKQRGMGEDDARARIAAQATREARLAVADFVVDNSGTLVHLEREVDRCWAWILQLQQR